MQKDRKKPAAKRKCKREMYSRKGPFRTVTTKTQKKKKT